MEKMKQVIAAAIDGHEPTKEETDGAIMEALDFVASIGPSLDRIATALERHVQPMHGIADHENYRPTPAS